MITQRKKQFQDALMHLQVMINKSNVRVEDAKYLLDAGIKLLLNYEEMEKSRLKWRTRAEQAEQKLKEDKQDGI